MLKLLDSEEAGSADYKVKVKSVIDVEEAKRPAKGVPKASNLS